MSDREEDDDSEEEPDMLDQFGGFLDNIGQMLEEDPLDEDGIKRSKKLALRSKLRGFKKKTE